jgi:histone-lysine N-methyltransferase SETMAR
MGVPSFVCSHSQKLDRVTLSLSQELFPILERQKQRSWHDIMTLNESWFYINLNTDHELIWIQPDGEIPERERRTIQSEKVMLTIVWNPSCFHLINVLPKGFNFNASFYVTQILGQLSDWWRTQVGRTNRKLWVHADNARPHIATVTLQFMQQNAMRRVPHPPYSLDLAPSDFYLFDYIKQLLLRCEFTDRD